MVVISITLPDKLLEKFDNFIKTRGYYSRSEAIRDAIRSLITEAEFIGVETERVAATIMVTCDYTRTDVDKRITEIRHEFDDIVVENIHRHINEKYCLEILIIEGDIKRTLTLIGRIRGIRGIYQVKSIFMPL